MKRLITSRLGLLMLAMWGAVSPSQAADTTNNLAAYYSLDGNATDTVTNLHDGVATDVAYVSGYAGLAASFNGTNSAISVPGFTFDPTNFTLAAWVKVSQVCAPRTMLIGTADGSIYLGTNAAGAFVEWEVFPDGNGRDRRFWWILPVTDPVGRWLHLALAVADRTNSDRVSLYLDGVKQTLGPATEDLLVTGDYSATRIGTNTLAGLLDEVRLYGRALSADDAVELTAGGNFSNGILVSTLAADTITDTWASLHALLNPKGTASELYFQYSISPSLLEAHTLAGSGAEDFADGTGSAARFDLPYGVAVDTAGNLYVGDNYNNRIRKITPDGVVTTLAGSGAYGFADGPTNTAMFDWPEQVALDGAGNVYVADGGNNRIRKITPDGQVSTVAGSGVSGFADGPTNTAMFHWPSGVAVDGAGNVFVADSANHRIRKITPDRTVITLAGTGVAGFADGPTNTAIFNWPESVAVDGAGNVYVADGHNNRIRKISVDGTVSTLAGSGTYGFADGPGGTAKFSWPYSLTLDAAGNVYVADTENNRIRKVAPNGVVTTLAGSGTYGFSEGPASVAKFAWPHGIAVDGAGNLYVGDTFNNRIRKLTPTTPVLAQTNLNGWSSATVEWLISDLAPETTYYFRAVGSNVWGAVNGTVLSFTTRPTNYPPTNIFLSHSSVLENQAVGTAVGTLSAGDPNPGDTFTFALVSGAGDTDNAAFTVAGDVLRTAAVLDYESKSSLSVRLRVTDQNGTWLEKELAIAVVDVNEAPGFVKGPDVVVNQNAGPQLFAAWATGISTGDGLEQTLEFLVGNDRTYLFTAQPAIATNGDLTFTPATNLRGTNTVTVRLRDNGGTLNGGQDTSPPQTFLIVVGSPVDANGDGLPDDWQAAYGLTTEPASADSDGDGFSNADEYLAGTDPTNSGDALRILSVDAMGTDALLTIQTVVGKIYRLERNDGFPNGPWNQVGTNLVGAVGTIQVWDTNASTLSNGVYRVKVIP